MQDPFGIGQIQLYPKETPIRPHEGALLLKRLIEEIQQALGQVKSHQDWKDLVKMIASWIYGGDIKDDIKYISSQLFDHQLPCLEHILHHNRTIAISMHLGMGLQFCIITSIFSHYHRFTCFPPTSQAPYNVFIVMKDHMYMEELIYSLKLYLAPHVDKYEAPMQISTLRGWDKEAHVVFRSGCAYNKIDAHSVQITIAIDKWIINNGLPSNFSHIDFLYLHNGPFALESLKALIAMSDLCVWGRSGSSFHLETLKKWLNQDEKKEPE